MNLKTDIFQRITNLCKQIPNTEVKTIEQLPGAGSTRKYYIIRTNNNSYLACWGSNIEENETFLYYSTVFKTHNLPVPKILAQEKGSELYIVEYLGNIDLLTAKQNCSSEQTIELFKKAIDSLIQFQLIGGEHIDFSKSFSRSIFDATAMQWDLSYFKYYYLKLTDIECNEQKLERDFATLIHFLEQAPAKYFMYRDFQSRNIMVDNSNLYFIDYQGGMKGPLQYDLVSLLYQAKANLSENERNILLEYYIQKMEKHVSIDKIEFMHIFDGFVYIRILQTLGAYGYRGLIQNKKHFIESIPQAVQNVQKQNIIISKHIQIPYLCSIIEQLPILSK